MENSPVRLSGVVVAQDEERDLPRCLAALSFCDEIVVIDGGSRDGSVAAARAAGAKVVVNPWPGYGAQRAFSLQQASGEYVLAVDADEVVDTELRSAIQRALAEAPRPGYWVRVENHLAGRTLRHGGLRADLHLRLFRRELASYPDQLHAGARLAVPDRELGQLGGALQHWSYASLSEYLAKCDRYSTALARERAQRGASFSALGAMLRLPFAFAKRYVFQLGFLDGYAGFLYAAMAAYTDFLKLAKLGELQGK